MNQANYQPSFKEVEVYISRGPCNLNNYGATLKERAETIFTEYFYRQKFYVKKDDVNKLLEGIPKETMKQTPPDQIEIVVQKILGYLFKNIDDENANISSLV